MTVIPLTGVPRYYDWGSRTAIQKLTGKDSGEWKRLAELWFGAHPDSPSDAFGIPLDERIKKAPIEMVGAKSFGRFGPTLPYLVKILAADRPLSIQVHPTLAQAQAGYEEDNRRGISHTSPRRTFRDRNHKPELLVALTPFQALCGFRPIDQTLTLLGTLDGLAPLRDILRQDGLHAALSAVLELDSETVFMMCRSLRDSPEQALRGAQHAAACFPGDPGALVALLLNYVILQPGEALYLGAGTIHAYLRGMGVEVMANSDNVLRAGLTSKHVDVHRLLAHTDFTPAKVHPLTGGSFVPPVPDFAVTSLDLDHKQRLLMSGCLVLCTDGKARLDDQVLDPGEAAFIPVSSDVVTMTGPGEVFVVTDNLA